MAGASKYLADLPSRGPLSSPAISSNLSSVQGRIRVYVCDHDTSPPEDQLIITDTANILIRSLQINKQKSDAKDVTTKATIESSKGKRSAARALEVRTPAKRVNTASSSSSPQQVGSSTAPSEKILQTLTVERLRALLKERGLSPKGRKDELIGRLKEKTVWREK